MKKLFTLLIAGLFVIACQPKPENTQVTTKTEGLGTVAPHAMVVSAHPEASQVGVNIMKKGGNAYDAAVAVQFALQVVYPRAGNIAGGGFAVLRQANGATQTLDFREKAPLKASKTMYQDENGKVIEGLSTEGVLAVGVPGSVAGMVQLHEKYGNLPWAELVQPAIDLAEKGVVVTSSEADNYNRFHDQFLKLNKDTVLFVKNRPWQAGDTLKQPALAETLKRIRDKGRDGFYEGPTADAIVKVMQEHQGLISHEDLEQYHAKWRKPVTGRYRGYKVISMPPPSSGGVALIQLLEGTEHYNITPWGHNSAKEVHLMTELERRVYADRATYLGDPDFYPVPVKRLLDSIYIAERNANISMTKATPSQDIKEGKVEVVESMETTHFSIVDSAGNAIAITTTLNGYFGCKVMVQAGGFFLNNEMDDFSAKAGVPNQFGLVGGKANEIQPEKRMLSSMTPTILEKDGKLAMVLGTPGGSTIITSIYQTVLNVVDYHMTLQQAINAKKTHSQWLPDVIFVEDSLLSKPATDSLENMGHQLQYVDHLGLIDAVRVLPNGELEGAADYTRNEDNTATGY